jgi:hypothetical protein
MRGGAAEGTRHDRSWGQEDQDLPAHPGGVQRLLAYAKRKPTTRGMLLRAGRLVVLLLPVSCRRAGGLR